HFRLEIADEERVAPFLEAATTSRRHAHRSRRRNLTVRVAVDLQNSAAYFGGHGNTSFVVLGAMPTALRGHGGTCPFAWPPKAVAMAPNKREIYILMTRRRRVISSDGINSPLPEPGQIEQV